MKPVVRNLTVAACALVLLTWGGKSEAEGTYVAKLPDFTLKDPAEKDHTDESILGLAPKGLVVCVTVPNSKHGPMQSKWQDRLMKKDWPSEKLAFVMLEDVSQSGKVRDKALESMKEKYKPDQQPVLLIDHTGDVRRSFRVPEDSTVLMVFDPQGNLIHTEDAQTTVKETQPNVEAIRRVQKVLEKLTQ